MAILCLSLIHIFHVDESDQNAVGFALGCEEGENADGIPSSVLGLNLPPHIARSTGHLQDGVVQVGQVDAEADMAEGTAHVAGKQMQQLLRGRGEAADAPVRAQNDNRNIHIAEDVTQLVTQMAQFPIALL